MDRYLTLICKTEIASAHYLTKVPEGHKCGGGVGGLNPHGHFWKIEVRLDCLVQDLSEDGMMVDFGELKECIRKLDHQLLNRFVENPTCENLCIYLAKKIEALLPKAVTLSSIKIEESPGNSVQLGVEF